MVTARLIHPHADPNHVGFLPGMLEESDPRPAREQFNERYAHGGGWFPMSDFEKDSRTHVLRYPGDPPMRPYAIMQLRDEMILVYQYGIVVIVQPDGTFEVARMD